MSTLATVEAFARSAHEGQRRKYANEPYINHPVRVMQICAEYVTDEVVLEAALLHDVIEDTEVSANMLFKFLQTLHPGPEAVKVLKLVQELTDEYVSAKYPGVIIGNKLADLAKRFIEAVAMHRFWEREKPRKVPA